MKKYIGKILNLTQHPCTPDQTDVVEPGAGDKRDIQALLTFSEPPGRAEIICRAKALANIARATGCAYCMIGGAPYLMGPLERALRAAGIVPYYAFTRRESRDDPQPDGTVKKTTTFAHEGWVIAV